MTTAQLPAVRTTTSVAPITTGQPTQQVEHVSRSRLLVGSVITAGVCAAGSMALYASDNHTAAGLLLAAGVGPAAVVAFNSYADHDRRRSP